jgi:hypothetical protein
MGDQVNPGLFNPDFSGYERAGQAKGAAMANLGADIGGAIKVHGDNKKKVKKTEDLIKAVMNNFEGTALGDQASQMFEQFASEDVSQRDQLAMGESIAEVLNVGLAGMEQKRANEMFQLEKASMAAKGPRYTPLSPEQVSAIQANGGTVKGYWDGGMFMQESATMGQPKVPLVTFGSTSVGPDGMPLPGQPVGGATKPSIRDAFSGDPVGGGQPTPEHLRADLAPGTATPDGYGVTRTPIPPAGGFGQAPSLPGDPVQGEIPMPPSQSAPSIPVPQPSPNGPAPLAPLPQKDVWKLDEEGRPTGATRIKDSTHEIDYKIKEATFNKLTQGLGIEKDLSEAEKTQLLKDSDDFTNDVRRLVHLYNTLDQKGDIPAAGRPGMVAAAKNLPYIKGLATAAGAEGMTERAAIDAVKLNLMKSIRSLSGMGTKEMDTPQEVKRQLDAMGSPEMPIESTMIALKGLIDKYGNGASFDDLMSPSLKARYSKFAIPEKREENEAGVAPDTQSFLDKYPSLK